MIFKLTWNTRGTYAYRLFCSLSKSAAAAGVGSRQKAGRLVVCRKSLAVSEKRHSNRTQSARFHVARRVIAEQQPAKEVLIKFEALLHIFTNVLK